MAPDQNLARSTPAKPLHRFLSFSLQPFRDFPSEAGERPEVPAVTPGDTRQSRCRKR